MLRTRLTLKPGSAGTKKLLAQYGSRLVCVRYRYDDELEIRCKTIELILEEIPWPRATPRQPRATDVVQIRLRFDERALRDAIKRRGGTWDPSSKTWSLRYSHALALRLTDRIVR